LCEMRQITNSVNAISRTKISTLHHHHHRHCKFYRSAAISD
jgi:hypothetical protein